MKDKIPSKKNEFETSVPFKKQLPKIISVIFLSAVVAYMLNMYQPEVEKKIVKDELPFVEYIVAKTQSMSIPVMSQGSVSAKTVIKLVAEVSGQVKHMAKLKFNGGFFKKGDLLLRIDDTEYQLKIAKAKAQVAAAKQQLVRVETEAGQAKYDLKQIGRDPSKSSSYALREPQLAEAKANFQAAKADLKIAQLQIQRTKIKAPFDGRVVSKLVDITQFVSVGTLLANIYSTESVIVRLPLRLNQAELLGLRLGDNQVQINAVKINLSSASAKDIYHWPAILSHIEGEIDLRNRLVYLVAEVKAPYAQNKKFINRSPLTPGMFVKAQLSGVKREVIKLPRLVLRQGGSVWLIDDESKLTIKKIDILYKDEKFIYVDSGLNDEDKIITSLIDYPLNGMSLTSSLKSKAQSMDIQ